jgi:hypothetical protein
MGEMFVPGVGGELMSQPASNDTFKLRRLADGSTYEVLKNDYITIETNCVHTWNLDRPTCA